MIPRLLFDEDLNIFRESVKKFMEQEVIPYHDQWEKDGQVSREVWRKAGETGLLCATMPEEYGGAGADFRYSTVIIEEGAAHVGATTGFNLHSDIVAPYILHNGSEDLKRKWLPKFATGEVIGAIAMTEPGTGSDLQGIKTRAIADGDEYVINGSKTFITNGILADVCIVVCKTDPAEGAKGTSLLLVEADRPGFTKGQNLNKIGMKAQDTSELFFDDVRVPKGNLLGDEGKGFVYLMQELPQERLLVALGGMTAMEVIYHETVQYTRERKAFGKSIADFQNTRFVLAELKTEITAARVFTDRCLEMHLAGELTVELAAMVKLHVSELQCKVIDACLQLHGGYGYMWEYPVARAWADARVQRIYGGTSEIMKELISRDL